MADAPSIVLSAGQKHVYDAIYRLTDRGRHAWVGVLSVAGLPGSTMRAAVETLGQLGTIAVTDEPGVRARRYQIKVFPHRIIEGSADAVCAARWRFKEPWYDARPIRDTGAFMAAVRSLGLLPFADEPRAPKSTGIVSRMSVHRPAARAL